MFFANGDGINKDRNAFSIVNLELDFKGMREFRTVVLGIKKPYRSIYEFRYEENDEFLMIDYD